MRFLHEPVAVKRKYCFSICCRKAETKPLGFPEKAESKALVGIFFEQWPQNKTAVSRQERKNIFKENTNYEKDKF